MTLKTRRAGACVALVAAMVCALTAQRAPQQDKQFQAALQNEMVAGDLKAAIEDYRAIAARPGVARDLAAQALVRMAGCYQKLGDVEAIRIYERVVREFGDQASAAREARARLATLQQSTSATLAGGTPKRVWTPARADSEGGNPGVHQYGKVSRSGRYLPFITYGEPAGGLFIRDLATGSDRRLVATLVRTSEGSQADYKAVMSPDDRMVAYLWLNGYEKRFELRLAETQGGVDARPRVLLSNKEVQGLWLHDWSADGKWLAAGLGRVDGTHQVALVSAADGTTRVLKTTDWRSRPSNMSFSPDGKYLAFDLPQGDSSARDIFVLATDASRAISAVVHKRDDALLGWSPDGQQLLFASDRTGSPAIWATAFDLRSFAEPRIIKQDVGEFGGLGLTAAGSFFYITRPAPIPSQIMSAAIDFANGSVVAGPHVAVPEYVGTNTTPIWSHDGKLLAYRSSRRAYFALSDPADDVLVIRTLATDQPRELRPRLDHFLSPQWMPDDQALVVQGTDFEGRRGLFRIDARTGDTMPVAVAGATADGAPSRIRWSPDGGTTYFLLQTSNAETRRRGGPQEYTLFERDIRSGTERKVAHWTGAGGYAISPSGRTLYYQRSRSLSRETP